MTKGLCYFTCHSSCTVLECNAKRGRQCCNNPTTQTSGRDRNWDASSLHRAISSVPRLAREWGKEDK